MLSTAHEIRKAKIMIWHWITRAIRGADQVECDSERDHWPNNLITSVTHRLVNQISGWYPNPMFDPLPNIWKLGYQINSNLCTGPGTRTCSGRGWWAPKPSGPSTPSSLYSGRYYLSSTVWHMHHSGSWNRQLILPATSNRIFWCTIRLFAY